MLSNDPWSRSNGGRPEDASLIGKHPDGIDRKVSVYHQEPTKASAGFAMSVFNLMNAILGSGILGLGEVVKNLGVLPFVVLLLMTACLAFYTIDLLLQSAEMAGHKSFEGLAQATYGIRGKVVTSIVIILHCLGAMCSYVYIIKKELPEVVKVFMKDSTHYAEGTEPWYFNGNLLMLLVVVGVIVPLACMKDIKFLGYSSAFGMTCMLLFTFTVVTKKFDPSIPCPLSVKEDEEFDNTTIHEEVEVQYCSPKIVNINPRTAYAVPTMFFAFMCHASMLPIYDELRRPSITKMRKIAVVSIMNVLFLYMLSAIFGYLTFYNLVESELLLTYSKAIPTDPLIIVSRIMVIVCVTLSVPLLHYPARKTVVLTAFKNPHEFNWVRHILIMLVFIGLCVIFVLYIPNIRDIFGFAGATTSASLLVIFPSLFFLKLTNKPSNLRKMGTQYTHRRKSAFVLIGLGVIFICMSVTLIIMDWMT
jgi:amino acid permease